MTTKDFDHESTSVSIGLAHVEGVLMVCVVATDGNDAFSSYFNSDAALALGEMLLMCAKAVR